MERDLLPSKLYYYTGFSKAVLSLGWGCCSGSLHIHGGRHIPQAHSVKEYTTEYAQYKVSSRTKWTVFEACLAQDYRICLKVKVEADKMALKVEVFLMHTWWTWVSSPETQSGWGESVSKMSSDYAQTKLWHACAYLCPCTCAQNEVLKRLK